MNYIYIYQINPRYVNLKIVYKKNRSKYTNKVQSMSSINADYKYNNNICLY